MNSDEGAKDLPESSSNLSTDEGVTGTVDILDVSTYNARKKHSPSVNIYNKALCEDNKLLIKFINKCIVLDPTLEMESIISKVLLPSFTKANKEYKDSSSFHRVITKAYQRLEEFPEKKYSHINDVHETLKRHAQTQAPQAKKRIGFVTLSKTVTAGSDKSKKRTSSENICDEKPKRSRDVVIALDCEDDEDDDVIAIDDRTTDRGNHDTVPSTTSDIESDLIEPKLEYNLLPNKNTLLTNEIKLEHNNTHENVTNERGVVDDENTIGVLDSQDFENVDEIQTNCGNGILIDVRSVPNSEWNSVHDNNENLVMNLNDPRIKPLNQQEYKSQVKDQRKKLDHTQQSVIPNEYDVAVTRVSEELESNADETEETIEIRDSQEFNIVPEVQSDDKENNEQYIRSGHLEDSENQFLTPVMEVVQLEKKTQKNDPQAKNPQKMSEAERTAKIKSIEAEIARTNDQIAALEVAEVTNDSASSPYILVDKLQAHIVKLYKDLCSLVDAEPVKRRKVRLEVSQGYPQGPVKRLERFLNKQVNDFGVAPFPDFDDVVRCVEKSNRKDGLGWSKSMIISQAQEMFRYCGRALQKRRQRREWKHLKLKVPRQVFDDDPAERDPELMAKLELNRQIAMKREAEVIDKYARKEATHTSTSPRRLSLQLMEEKEKDIPDSDSSSTEETPSDINLQGPIEKENAEGNNEAQDLIVNIKQEPIEPIQYKGDISLVIEISDSDDSDDEDGGIKEGR